MKFSENSATALDKLISITPEDTFVVYLIEDATEEAFEVISIDATIVADNEFGEFFELCDLFEKITPNLKPGIYFSVYRNRFGTDYFTTEVK